MNWRIHLIAALLLSLSVSRIIVKAQDEPETDETAAGAEADQAQADDKSVQVDEKSAQTPADPHRAADDNIVGQGLFPGLYQGFGKGIGIWKLMFPALGMLFNWAGTMPTSQLLGAAAGDPLAVSPSRVVLVLAEDNKGARATRENSEIVADSGPEQAPPIEMIAQSNAGAVDPFAQVWQTIQQQTASFGQPGPMLAQAVQGIGQPGPMLAQAMQGIQQQQQGIFQMLPANMQPIPIDLTQNPGAMLGQSIQTLQGQFPINIMQLIGGGAAGAGSVGAAAPPASSNGGTIVGAAPEQSLEGESEVPPSTPQQDVNVDISQTQVQQTPDQILGSALSGVLPLGWPQDPGQLLGQAMQQQGINIDWSQNPGQMLGSALQNVPGMQQIDFTQTPDQILGSALQQQGINLDFQQNPVFQGQFPFNIMQPGGNIVGSAQDGQVPMQNIQTIIDSGNAMLGSALQQPQQQLNNLFGFKPYQGVQPAVETPIAAQASEITEVRVKPDVEPSMMPTDIGCTNGAATIRTPSAKMSEMKMKAAMQQANGEKTMPILWFHPSGRTQTVAAMTAKTPEEQQIESKLLAFERQVIQELQLLQEIERQAQELRAAAKQAKTFKEAPYKLSYPLTQTPIHKITRDDIERAMSDEYFRKLLQKAAQRRYKIADDQHSKADASGVPVKRQTFRDATNAPLQHLTKEDITKMMAYAYRMANANGPDGASMMHDGKATDPRQWLDSSDGRPNSWTPEQMSQQRQWITPQQQPHGEQRQWIDAKMAQMMIDEQREQRDRTSELMQRQRMEQAQMQRQWLEDQQQQQAQTHKMEEMQQRQQQEMQRQWAEQQQNQEQERHHHTAAQTEMGRQWAEAQQQSPEMRQMAEKQQHMPVDAAQMHRPMAEIHQHMPTDPAQTQRQWVKPQHETPEMRQMAEKHQQMPADSAQTQRQWAEEQQQSSEMRQMAEKQQHMPADPTQAQRQWAEPPQQSPEMRQMAEKQQHMPADSAQAQRQWAEQQQQSPEMRQMAAKHQHMPADSAHQQQHSSDMRQMAEKQQHMPQHSPEMRQMTEHPQHMHADPAQMQRQSSDMNTQPEPHAQHAPMMPEMPRQMTESHKPHPIDAHSHQHQIPVAQQRQMMVMPPQSSHAQDMPRQMDEMHHLKDTTDPMMMKIMPQQQQPQPLVGEAQPQMPEHAAQPRFKGLGLFDDLLSDFGGHSGSKKRKQKPTVVNYYYNQYPSYGGSGGYSSGGYGGGSSGGYGGSSGGYGGGSSGGYGGGSSGGYGGGSSGGYGGSSGGYGGGSSGGYGGGGYGGGSSGGYGGGSSGGYGGGSSGGYGGGSSGGYGGGSSGGYGGGSSGGYGGGSSGGYGGGSSGGYGGGSSGGYGGGSSGGYGGGSSGGYGGSDDGYSSGGSSYGGGGSGSNAYGSSGGYRTAVGNEEIEEMLRQHKIPTNLTPSQAEQKPQTTLNPLKAQQRSMEQDDDDDDDQQENSSPIPTVIAATFSKACSKQPEQHQHQATPTTELASDVNGDDQTATRLATTSVSSKKSRLGFSRRGSSRQNRCKRTATAAAAGTNPPNSYSMLQTIDQESLSDLRRDFKESLKEITLRPGEDPSEALMRYNAESVREALERANQQPMEISTADGEDIAPQEEEYYRSTAGKESISGSAQERHYYDNNRQPQEELTAPVANGYGAYPGHMAHGHMSMPISMPMPVTMPQHNHHQHMLYSPHSSDVVQPMPPSYGAFELPYTHTNPFGYPRYNSHSETSNALEAARDLGSLLHADLTISPFSALLATIKESLKSCCEKCKDRILNGLRKNLSNEELITGNEKKSNGSISDEEHENWLQDMTKKGYDRNYLTKAHQWQYQQSGRLYLTDESEENYAPVNNARAQYSDNELKALEHSHKRGTIVANDDEKVVGKAVESTTTEVTKYNNNNRNHIDNNNKNNVNITPKTNALSKTYGKAFAKPTKTISELKPVPTFDVNVHLLDTHGSTEDPTTTTVSPYALRGKFQKTKASSTSNLERIYKSNKSHATAPTAQSEAFKASESKMQNNIAKAIAELKDAQAEQKKTNMVEILSFLYELSRLGAEPKKLETTQSRGADTDLTTVRTQEPQASQSTTARTTYQHQRNRRPKSRRRLSSRTFSATNANAESTSSVKVEETTTVAAREKGESSLDSYSQHQNPETVGISLFSFDRNILKPFMGVRSTKHKDDPWLHKPYDPHRPLYTGGGSYDSYLGNGRYRRDISDSTVNILTPSMLDRLLRLKAEFQKKFPQLYKTMLDQLHDPERTRITVKPPVIPAYVAYPPVELGAAEKTPEEDQPEKENDSNNNNNSNGKTNKDDVDYFHFEDADVLDAA